MQQPDATEIVPDCQLRRHCQSDIRCSGLRTRILPQLVAPLVLSWATPGIKTIPIDAAIKAKTSDTLHLYATPASQKPAAEAATHFRLLLRSNLKPELVSCRINSPQSQLERMQS